MIEDDFYATLKFKSGEEIFCKVASTEEENECLLIVSNPVVITEIKGRVGLVGYKLEPWLKTSKTISEKNLKKMFDINYHLKRINVIFKRVFKQ